MNKIGVFDSGLGGLSAIREILKILPEDIIYFGDTGRVPYGNRSYDIIKKYGRQSVNFLLSKGVKKILVACGTVSSVALDDLRAEFAGVPLFGVIESACEKAVRIAECTGNKKIGVIGTQATVSSGAYEQYIKKLNNSCEVYSKACPLFVPLVENGHISDELAKLAASEYLRDLKELEVSSLILGCTHYPMLKDIISEIMGTELIDAGAEAARRLKLGNNLLNECRAGSLEIFISDEGMKFSEIASSFLGFDIKSGISKIEIEKY